MAETLEVEEINNNTSHHDPDLLQRPTSSSSDSESDNSDAEEELLHSVVALEKELTENPASSYETHVQYIKSLRKLGHIEKLREARESMNSLFPLTPTMWQEWAKDEASLISTTGKNNNNEAAFVEKLYERGVHEYLSVFLWCDYVNFVKEYDPSVAQCSPDGILKMRNLLERSVTAAGLHVLEGNKIWRAYVEFEQSVLQNIIDDDQSNDNERREKQVQRIRSIFHRQLSVPLVDSGSTLLAYKTWEAGQHESKTIIDLDGIVPSHVASAYQKSMEMYNARAFHEKQICKQEDVSEGERLQYFMVYLKFEQSLGDPSRVQILYERAVTEFPLSNDLWLDYTRYLDQTLKVTKNIIMSVYSRAMKNCPWTCELWVQYLLSLERSRASEEELSSVFEQSLQCSFSSFEEYLNLFLTRIDGLRRSWFSQASSTVDVLENYHVMIRDTFKRATDYLSPHLTNMEGLLLQMYVYWARLEWNLGKDIVAARGVWESFLKTNGSMIEAWQHYITLEIETGHVDAARNLYKRCYSKRFVGTGSEDICHSWVRFERELGTLENYDHAVRKVTPRLEELQLFKMQQESEAVVASAPSQKEVHPAKKASQKRNTSTRSSDEQPLPKRQKAAVDNLSQMDTSEKSSGEDDVGTANLKAGKPETANKQQIKHSTNKEMYKDQCTAFLSNLSLQVKDEDLRNFFSDIGGVTAIRILKDKYTGKSRGLAYVDFCDGEHLTTAVKKNKRILLGKKLSIVRSDPKHSKNTKTSKEQGESAGPASDSVVTVEMSDSKKSFEMSKQSVASASQMHGDHLKLKGKNTFVPRNLIRPLGWSKNEPKKEETLKSNDEFRNMLLKKTRTALDSTGSRLPRKRSVQ